MASKDLAQDSKKEVAVETTLEKFLRAVEGKTKDPVHLRLLKVCREANPSGGLEAELRAVAAEILDET